MKSISPIIATILIVVMTVAIAGIFYTYNSGRINYSNISSNLTSGTSTNITSISLEYTQITTNISLGYIPIIIYNTQNIPTPSPFQQDIAICNGSINIGPNFAYINNATLFNLINPNGQDAYFATTNNSAPNIYSWYEGQLSYNGFTCDVWWVNIPQGIPANSNVTIYMYIGNSSDNYYSQYYPYVGVSPQEIPGYDNGQDVFIAYGYFDSTFDGWSAYTHHGYFSPTATPNGIEILNDQDLESTYILPPNNGNIPEIPLIVEEAWYYTQSGQSGDANAISLFGNTNQQFYAAYIGSTAGSGTPASNLSTFVQFEYYPYPTPTSDAVMLKSAVTDQYLNYTYFLPDGGTVYSYLIVNSTYAQAGYYYYNSNQIWSPLTLLDTYTYNVYNPTNINNGISGYTYYNLNYNPFQFGTLEIGAGDYYGSYQYVEWVVARAYPPNGIMPSIYIG